MQDIRKADDAASRGPNRKAAQIKTGKQMKSSGCCCTVAARMPPKTIPALRIEAKVNKDTSIRFLPSQSNLGLFPHKIKRGATAKSPAASPNHQVSQIHRKSAHLANPLILSAVTPTVAETTVLRPAASIRNRTASETRAKACLPFANRWTR